MGAISAGKRKAVFRFTDAPITPDGRQMEVGIVLGDLISLRPKGRQAVKKIPISVIAKRADSLIKEAAQPDYRDEGNLKALSTCEVKDGKDKGRVEVSLVHGDTLRMRIEGSQREVLLPIGVAYTKACERMAAQDRADRKAERELKRSIVRSKK